MVGQAAHLRGGASRPAGKLPAAAVSDVAAITEWCSVVALIGHAGSVAFANPVVATHLMAGAVVAAREGSAAAVSDIATVIEIRSILTGNGLASIVALA
jgi:hypothetical protein